MRQAGKSSLGMTPTIFGSISGARKVFIGYGSGALAIIDPASHAKIGDIPLRAHPEGFQLAGSRNRIFVNLPDARQIAVVDTAAAKVAASWTLTGGGANFPMAIDDRGARVLVVARSPARLVAFAMNDGSVIAQSDTCRDADDVFFDAKRARIYVSCGDGYIDVLEQRGIGYQRIAHIQTAPGARTSLFSCDLDRLFLAVRKASDEPASIWIFRASP